MTSITLFSHSFAALGFLFLSLLLMTSWRGRLHGMALTIASLLTSIWAAIIASQAVWGPLFLLLANILEILRNAGWSVFLLMVLGHFQQTKTLALFKSKFLVAMLAAFYCILLATTVYSHWKIEFPHQAIDFMTGIVGRVALAVLGMLLVEQLYRNTPYEERWGIKFACLGMGGLFAYDFYLYCDAMLFRKINQEIWAARGVVNALIVPLIAVSAARNPQWSLDISVSRRIVFHSAALFGCAAYLLVMAAAGYYLRLFGGNWGIVMQAAFLFGAVILLITVLFSGAVRAWLKVFISKHFYNYGYDYRDEWLRFTSTLSAEGPGLNQRTIQAVAQLMESPGGALFIFRESDNCELVAHWNMSATHNTDPANRIFCRFLEKKQWVIDLDEYRSAPEKYEALSLPPWLQTHPKAWLVVPLILHSRLFGFIVLAQPRSRIALNWEATDLLKIAGNQAASYLVQQESANALMVARQFESFNRMSTFMVHDLKNLTSQLSLLLANAKKHKNNLEFQSDMLETVDYSVQKMKLLLQKLSRGASTEKPVPLFIDKLLQQAVATKSAAGPKPALEIRDEGLLVFADPARLERVIGHIIQNAIEATPKDGQVVIRLARQGHRVLVDVEDTGQGMSEDFIREHLFKPFESTKPAGMGIGVFESHSYIHELGGRLEVFSRLSAGTTFRVTLPLHQYDDVPLERTA